LWAVGDGVGLHGLVLFGGLGSRVVQLRTLYTGAVLDAHFGGSNANEHPTADHGR
jgi:hypothetical protein